MQTHILARPEVVESDAESLLQRLREQLRCLERLVELLRERHRASSLGDLAKVQDCLGLEADLLGDLALVERERLEVLRCIERSLGRERPSRLRLAELVLHVGPELRDELLEVREEIRDIADELETHRARAHAFAHHHVGRVKLFLDPESSARLGGEWTGRPRPSAGDDAPRSPASGAPSRRRGRAGPPLEVDP